jgi:putative integral membrane protein (TIGR02587 family)
LGFYIDPLRLALFLILFFPLLIGLAYYSGFEETFGWKNHTVDALVAYAVGFITGGVILILFTVIEFGMSTEEIIGKVSIQAVPASIGAMLAQSQFGSKKKEQEKREEQAGYFGELFLMVTGALFLGLNVAPTEEMVLISYQMTHWHSIGLVIVSLIIMHAFVYAVEFKGQAAVPPGTSLWSIFLRFTIAGYALVLLISLYILWTFGQIQGMSLEQIVMATIVPGFPAAVGAAAARLIL